MARCGECRMLYDKNSNCYDYEKEESLSCDSFIYKDSGLTVKENVVLKNLVSAWNEFNNLEEQHPGDSSDFGDAINKAQQVLRLRVLRRDYHTELNRG